MNNTLLIDAHAHDIPSVDIQHFVALQGTTHVNSLAQAEKYAKHSKTDVVEFGMFVATTNVRVMSWTGNVISWRYALILNTILDN